MADVVFAYHNFPGIFCGVLQEITLLLSELWTEELVVDTLDVATFDNKSGLDSVRSMPKGKHRKITLKLMPFLTTNKQTPIISMCTI